MRVFIVFARILVTAAVLVLALRCYIAVESGSILDTIEVDDGTSSASAVRADALAYGLRDFGILLGLAGAMIALDRRFGDRTPRGRPPGTRHFIWRAAGSDPLGDRAGLWP